MKKLSAECVTDQNCYSLEGEEELEEQREMKGVDQDQGLAKLLDSDESSSDSDEEEKKKKDEDEDGDDEDGKGKGKKVNDFKSFFF